MVQSRNVALLVVDDGREDYLERGLASAREHLPVEQMPLVLVQDNEHKLGFAGAIREGWRRALATGADWIFWLESDFELDRDVPLDDMIRVLEAHPYLVQIALLRQPWSPAECEAGGIMQMHPEDYHAREWDGLAWHEHARFFTTNPTLVPRWVLERGWPQCAESEGHFGIALFGEDAARRSAFWGRGEQWVTHQGLQRAGVGY